MSLFLFGLDLKATVSAGHVVVAVVVMGVIPAALLSGILSFRSAQLLQNLTAARLELLRISQTDQLTGLLNRRGFDEMANAALVTAYKSELSVVGVMLDIDRFKMINDTFGHEFGDEVLVQVSNLLRGFARGHQMIVGRHGGEEFAVVCVGKNIDEVMCDAESLRRECAAMEVLGRESSANVTISIGVVQSTNEMSLSTIMRQADEALYGAKNTGRNRVVRAKMPLSLVAA
jgi:diguanylate cyclase (GGDEF)-like protein